MPTITSQIETVERNIKECSSQLNVLNKRITDDEHTLEERKRLKEEVSHLSAEVDQHEKELKHLRWENRKTMLSSVAVFILCTIVYMLYTIYM